MSKAFTKESDDEAKEPISPRVNSALPPGATNYMTADGAERFRQELESLMGERARVGGDLQAKERFREVEQRIADLQQMLGSAEIVEHDGGEPNEVRFGAIVTVRERSGEESSYRIVGADELDLDRGWVSWFSPIARALMGARVGKRVRFRLPRGERELEVVGVRY